MINTFGRGRLGRLITAAKTKAKENNVKGELNQKVLARVNISRQNSTPGRYQNEKATVEKGVEKMALKKGP